MEKLEKLKGLLAFMWHRYNLKTLNKIIIYTPFDPDVSTLFSVFFIFRSSKYMFHIFKFIYLSFTGILRTHNNIVSSSQLAW